MFAKINNLYRFIARQPVRSKMCLFPFSHAETVRAWLSWIGEQNADSFSEDEKKLIASLIEAARLDFNSQMIDFEERHNPNAEEK